VIFVKLTVSRNL